MFRLFAQECFDIRPARCKRLKPAAKIAAAGDGGEIVRQREQPAAGETLENAEIEGSAADPTAGEADAEEVLLYRGCSVQRSSLGDGGLFVFENGFEINWHSLSSAAAERHEHSEIVSDVSSGVYEKSCESRSWCNAISADYRA